MPFTFSHPAIILPLTYLPKRLYSISGLIAGSIIPDFEYFLRMRVQSIYSHTWLGLFYFDIPLALLAIFIFHNIVRKKLIDNLPFFLKKRFSVFNEMKWNNYFKKNFVVVIISILIGAASHILWDSFTHPQGQFVEVIPLLNKNIKIVSIEIPIFKILQHLSTILGGFIVLFAIWKMPKSKASHASTTLKYWMMVMLITALIILIKFFLTIKHINYPNLIISGITGFLIAIIIIPFLMSERIRTLSR